MEEYIANGAELGWLIDPEERTVWIYRSGRAAECVLNPERIRGEGPVARFVLELATSGRRSTAAQVSKFSTTWNGAVFDSSSPAVLIKNRFPSEDAA